MKKIKNKKTIIFITLLLVIGLVGGTFAYYTSQNVFENLFQAESYHTEATESFTSPSSWTPGDTTPKTVSVTNKGNVDVAVRVHMTEEWRDTNNNVLSLKDAQNNTVAIINFASDLSNWTTVTESGTTYYYYNLALGPNETTDPLIESVTFNQAVVSSYTTTCVPDGDRQICTSTLGGYAGGTYKLTIYIETAQYNQYQNIWSTGTTINLEPDFVYAPSINGNIGGTIPSETTTYDDPEDVVDNNIFLKFRNYNNTVMTPTIIVHEGNNYYEFDNKLTSYENNKEVLKEIFGEEKCSLLMGSAGATPPNTNKEGVLNKVGTGTQESSYCCHNDDMEVIIYKNEPTVDFHGSGWSCGLSYDHYHCGASIPIS